jgi:hypothetical protein
MTLDAARALAARSAALDEVWTAWVAYTEADAAWVAATTNRAERRGRYDVVLARAARIAAESETLLAQYRATNKKGQLPCFPR